MRIGFGFSRRDQIKNLEQTADADLTQFALGPGQELTTMVVRVQNRVGPGANRKEGLFPFEDLRRPERPENSKAVFSEGRGRFWPNPVGAR